MSAETRDAIRAKGVSIWLKADVDVLMRRVKRRTDRPMLKTGDPEATLRHLLTEREPVYAQADLTVESRDVPHAAVIDDIIASLSAFLAAGGRQTVEVLASGQAS